MQFVNVVKKAIPFITDKASMLYTTCVNFTKHTVFPLIKKVALFFKKAPRVFAATVAVLVLLFLTTTVALATKATTAYSVVYGGKSLGAVASAEVLAEAEILAYDILDNAKCSEKLINSKLVKTVVSSDSLISSDKLADQLIASSDKIVSATVLKVNGKDVAAEKVSKNADIAIEKYLDEYKTLNKLDKVELSTNVKVDTVYTLRSDFEALPTVTEYLKEGEKKVPVQTVTTVVEERKIDYKVIKTKSSKYTVGTEIVTQKGVYGVEKVTYKLATTNGKISEKKELSSKLIKEPVAKKVIVGTKRVIAADKNGSAPMVWPVKRVARSYVSSYVGDGRGHKGMDIVAPKGTPIYAAEGGTVTYSGRDGSGYGNYIRIRHANGIETLYAHCSALYVKVGDKVASGESIAAVGCTGRSTGNHLHFEVHKNGYFVNPSNYIGHN